MAAWFVRATGPDGKFWRWRIWLCRWPAMDTINDSMTEPFVVREELGR